MHPNKEINVIEEMDKLKNRKHILFKWTNSYTLKIKK